MYIAKREYVTLAHQPIYVVWYKYRANTTSGDLKKNALVVISNVGV